MKVKFLLLGLSLGLSLTALTGVASAQWTYPNELGFSTGNGCRYGPYDSMFGVPDNANCWATGACINSRLLSVGIYQNWYCPTSLVTVAGGAEVEYIAMTLDGNNFEFKAGGLRA